MGSPDVHHAKNVEDAIIMLDSHVPLTHQERKLITESLYDLAFREGARQGRQAGMEAVYADIRARTAQLNPQDNLDKYVIKVLESLIPPVRHGEYTDTTTAIREKLAAKSARRTKMDGRYPN